MSHIDATPIDELLAEISRRTKRLETSAKNMREENERLRWRHPIILPHWNDLPDDVRSRLCREGSDFTNDDYGGDMAVSFYGALRSVLSFEDLAIARASKGDIPC